MDWSCHHPQLGYLYHTVTVKGEHLTLSEVLWVTG